jgi:hypothetical protein
MPLIKFSSPIYHPFHYRIQNCGSTCEPTLTRGLAGHVGNEKRYHLAPNQRKHQT